MDGTIELLKYLFGAMNGITETLALFILFCYDTSLGGKWRKNNGIAKHSSGALNGWREKMPLIFMPFVTWLAGVGSYYLPREIAGKTYMYEPLIFDFMAFAMFFFVGKWLLKSVFANMQLAGMTVADYLVKWVADEYKVKLESIMEQPKSAAYQKENINE